MARKKTRKTDEKDFAHKRTLNPPSGRGKKLGPEYTEEQPAEREIGQYSGRGTPPLQKK